MPALQTRVQTVGSCEAYNGVLSSQPRSVSSRSTGGIQNAKRRIKGQHIDAFDASDKTCSREAPDHSAMLQCHNARALESDFRHANLHGNNPDVTDAAACSAIPLMLLHHSMLEHSFGMLWLSPGQIRSQIHISMVDRAR